MSLNTGFLRYEYSGVNNFLCPDYDEKTSIIEVKVNNIVVEHNILSQSPYYLEIINTDLNIGDIITINRLTNEISRIVDYNNGSILSEKDLDLDSDQLFYLIQETKGNIEESTYLNVDSFNNNLSKNDYTVQKAFEKLDNIIYAKIDNQVLQLNNINSLTAGNYEGATVIVKGYYEDSDGGGGTFIYDSSKSTENNGGTIINGWVRQYEGSIDVKWFGAKGDSITDDSLAVEKAILASSNNSLFISKGIYKITKSLIIPKNTKILGDYAPKLGVFPIDTDSKIYLKPNEKINMPGSSFLFVGIDSNWDTITIDRTDLFQTSTYLVKIEDLSSASIEGVSIILDVNVYDSNNNITDISNDNTSICDFGLVIEGGSDCLFKDFSIFGYFNKSGISIVHSNLNIYANPDYNKFYNIDTMGEYGITILGSEGNDGQGISGTQFYGCNVYSKDHHSRQNYQNGTERGSGVLYIDGNLSFLNSEIQGHYFYGGVFRTYANTPIVLDHATSVNFNGVVFEYPSYTSNDNVIYSKDILGSIDTDYVNFVNCRNFNTNYVKNNFEINVDHFSIIGDSQFGSILLCGNGNYTKIDKNRIQFTNTPLLSPSGWCFEKSSTGEFYLKKDTNIIQKFNPNGGTYKLSSGTGYTKTINDNELIITSSYHKVIGSTDLYTITGGSNGMRLTLQRNTSNDTFTIPSSTSGNIRVSKDYTFTDSFLVLELFYNGSYWVDYMN